MKPAWRDEEGSDIIFFLNPCERQSYRSGWFTVPELLAWTRGEGPVLGINPALERAFCAVDGDWEVRLTRGLELSGVTLRTHAVVGALDAEKQVPGADF